MKRFHPTTVFLICLIALAGCGAFKESTKRVENRFFDFTADGGSKYCKEACEGNEATVIFKSEKRRQIREEAQERGAHGQLSPWGTSGPVGAVWCECDTPVPDAVWEYIYDDERPKL